MPRGLTPRDWRNRWAPAAWCSATTLSTGSACALGFDRSVRLGTRRQRLGLDCNPGSDASARERPTMVDSPKGRTMANGSSDLPERVEVIEHKLDVLAQSFDAGCRSEDRRHRQSIG